MRLQRLQEWRERRGLSTQELADLSQINRTTIYRIETLGTETRPSTAASLANALEVDVADLLEPGTAPPSGVNRVAEAARASGGRAALLVEVAVRMTRFRRHARRRPPEWVDEEVERRLQEEDLEPLERWALEGVRRELRREHDKRCGKYEGNHLGYLRERVSDEIFDFGWMSTVLQSSGARFRKEARLTDREVDEIEEVLDETQDRIDQLRQTIDEYRRTGSDSGSQDGE